MILKLYFASEAKNKETGLCNDNLDKKAPLNLTVEAE